VESPDGAGMLALKPNAPCRGKLTQGAGWVRMTLSTDAPIVAPSRSERQPSVVPEGRKLPAVAGLRQNRPRYTGPATTLGLVKGSAPRGLALLPVVAGSRDAELSKRACFPRLASPAQSPSDRSGSRQNYAAAEGPSCPKGKRGEP